MSMGMNRTKKKPKVSEDDDAIPQIVSLEIDDIEVTEERRSLVNKDEVRRIAHSLTKVGQLYPITVRLIRKKDEDNVLRLNEGLHRLEAARLLGWQVVNAVVLEINREDAALREIAENLFRNDLSPLERADLICQWAERTGQDPDKDAQDAHPGGVQPHDKGISKIAKELDLSRDDIRRAMQISAIDDQTKERLRSAKIDLTQKALLDLTKKTTEEQRASVEKLINPVKCGSRQGPTVVTSSAGADAQLNALKGEWVKARALRKQWDACDSEVRESFVITCLHVGSEKETADA